MNGELSSSTAHVIPPQGFVETNLELLKHRYTDWFYFQVIDLKSGSLEIERYN